MKKFSVEQIVSVLKQAEVGVPSGELIRKVGITEQTYYLLQIFGESPAINFYAPGSGFVPSGFENVAGATVLISNTLFEFGYHDGSSDLNTDFTGTTLTVTLTSRSDGIVPLTLIFGDPAFTGFSVVSNSIGATSSFSDGILTFTTPINFFTGTESIVFDYTTASAVPEPGTLVLLGTGLIGAAGLMRRKLLS